MFSSIGVHTATGADGIRAPKQVHVADVGFTQMNQSSDTTENVDDKPCLR